jgi:hypothetical protein
MADYLEGAGRNIHLKKLVDLLRSDRTVLRRDPPSVMEGYGGAKLPYSPTFSPGENPEITLGDIAETAWDVVSPLGLYAGDVEAAKGKAAKGSFPAVRKAIDKLRGAEYKVTAETPPSILRALREVEVPRETGLGKRFKSGEKEGIHRGTEAFGGIKNVGPMRAAYLRKMEEGAEGRLWYDKTSEDILRLVGGDPDKADKLANALATTSAGTPVGSNLMYGAKGWNQQAVGAPIVTGRFPQAMGADIMKSQASPEAAASGLKRNPFSAGLSVAWRPPTGAKGIRPTHDIHDVRAWGITDPLTGESWKKGVGEAGHRFLDEQADIVTQRANEQALGGVQDWTPYRSQAAAWIAQKAKSEGIPIEEAAKHYGDFVPDYAALVTREWVPGENTGHLIEALRAPESARRGFSESLEQAVRGPQGIDRLASEMGALSDTTLANRGVYEGATNPGYASVIPVGKATGANEIDPSSARLMDAIAAGHGLLGTQKQSAWNFAAGTSPVSKANLLRVNRGSPFSEDELARLQEAVPGMDVPMVDPKGARVLEFGGEQGARIKALRAAVPEAQIEPQALSGNLFPEDPGKYSTLPYIEKIEAGGPKVVEGFDRAMQTMAPQVLERTQQWAAQQGWTQAPWFKDAMQALSTGGLAKLKELQKAGVVPVAFVAGIEGMEGDGR